MATLALKKTNYVKKIRTYMGLIIITLGLAVFYGYTQYVKLSGAQNALANEQTQITTLQATETSTLSDYTNLKQSFDQKYSGVLNSLQNVYPTQENYTDLTRQLDVWFKDNNTPFDPVFMSNIQYGQARYDNAVDYAVLPVTMSITGSQDNFMKFLTYIENSGTLADKTRLMDVRSISINFSSSSDNATGQTGTAASKPTLDVSLGLNAYFQKPLQKGAGTANS